MGKQHSAEAYSQPQFPAGGLKAPAHIEPPASGPIPIDDALRRTSTPMDIKTQRVAEFAACQMLLDSLFSATSSSGRDLVTDPHISARYLHLEEVPDHIYVTMSRRAIADKTGLSRETVRRRTNKLIEDGVLIETNGNVRLGYRTRTKADVANVNILHAAALSFVKTINDHNARMPMDLPER